MESFIFVALLCTATSAWNGACQNMREVRIENLSKEGCEEAKTSYSNNPRLKQADCFKMAKGKK